MPGPQAPPSSTRRRRGLLITLAFLALAGGVAFWLRSQQLASPRSPAEVDKSIAEKRSAEVDKNPFLEEFRGDEGGDEVTGTLRTDEELKQNFQEVIDIKSRLVDLAEQSQKWNKKVQREEYDKAVAERQRLEDKWNDSLKRLEQDVSLARRQRPKDGELSWLAGEVLILVGGEPDEVLPLLQAAVAAGVDNQRLTVALARTQIEANQPQAALRTAAKALDHAPQDRYAWNAFMHAAFNTERFDDIVSRLDRAFPKDRPAWAEEMRADALAAQKHLEEEQTLRMKESTADDLPRVRLTIEHRRFVQPGQGKPTHAIETTGRGEVVVELFENQAPGTVANFLTLVKEKQYDRTRFYLAQPATLVAGGDPGSRTGSPNDDGSGGPGYFIQDEFNRPDARRHFRGYLSMVNNGPHTTGSQFFITLSPRPMMDGQFTVFGRVIKGQEVIDHLTLGRTNRHVGRSGRIIPGDLLVRAEVIRERPHEYRVVKDE